MDEKTVCEVKISAYPATGKLAGIIVEWDNVFLGATVNNARLVRFSDVWMMEKPGGSLHIGMPDPIKKSLVLTGIPAIQVWELYQRWVRTNSYELMP